MSLTSPVTIRLSAERRFLYEAEAACQKQSLSTYLRERLEKNEVLSPDPLKKISPSSPHEQGILLEILLLLRYMAGTEKLVIVRKDLERLNIPTWQGG
jgi:hypothetical protein